MKMLLHVFLIGAIMGAVNAVMAGDFSISSGSFENNSMIPSRYATTNVSGGKNVSPALRWENIPAGTKSLVLFCIDKHPVASNWLHWAVFDIPAGATSLAEGASGQGMPEGCIEINNSFGYKGYGGPQPPPGTGPHEYVFTICALSTTGTGASQDMTYEEIRNLLEGKILASASISGYFKR